MNSSYKRYSPLETSAHLTADTSELCTLVLSIVDRVICGLMTTFPVEYW